MKCMEYGDIYRRVYVSTVTSIFRAIMHTPQRLLSYNLFEISEGKLIIILT